MTYKFGMRTALVVGASAMALAMASTAANAVVTPATVVDINGAPMEEAAPIPTGYGNKLHEGIFYDGIRPYLTSQFPDEYNVGYHGYVQEEFFVSGETSGGAYTTRILVSRPSNPADFSGMAIYEVQHSAGAFQTWDHTRAGGMQDGHVYVGVNAYSNRLGANGPLNGNNDPRYAAISVPDDVANEIIAQVAALLKLDNPSGAEWTPNWIVMTGASQTAGSANNYMTDMEGGNADPAQAMPDGSLPVDAMYIWDNSGYNLEDDGSLDPDNLGGPLAEVPTIILATQSEFDGNYNAEDEAGKAPDSALYRLFQVPGAPHLGSRDGYAQPPEACDLHPLSQFMDSALMYMPIPIMHAWLADGVEPGHARVEFDENGYVRDEFGNAVGGVRSPQVEVPTATYYTGNQGSGFLCGLSGYQYALSDEVLDSLYTSRGDFAQQLRASAMELAAEGWFPSAYFFDIEKEIANYREPVDYDWLAEPFDWTAAEAAMMAAMAEEEDED